MKFPVPGKRGWGWAVQLYAVRSESSWGIGDLADLRELGAWASRLGARFIQVNPLMASQPVPPLEASPYYPCSRRFLNPIYLRIEEVPGWKGMEELAARGRALNESDLIDWDAVYRIKIEALQRLWAQSGARRNDDPDFARFAMAGGPGLRQYAGYCALAQTHGCDWGNWPTEFAHPDSTAVMRFMEANADQFVFHQWMQWLLEMQMEKVGRTIAIIQDIPVGFSPAGADAWAWQDLLALDADIGSPPDIFNPSGQNWGLPPFIPDRLRAAGYAPLRETFRAVLRHSAGLRIDHVLGLFRLYWIAKGSDSSQGKYVSYPHEEILSAIAAEFTRVGAFAVGEDLGDVSPLVRETMDRWGILGTKVLWFESGPPAGFPHYSLASISTHDLPTLAGEWTGSDAAEQRALLQKADPKAMRSLLERVLAEAGAASEPDVKQVIRSVYRLLAGASSVLVAATLDDALAAERRPNLPGTSLERPNWRIPLPKKLEAIRKDPLVLEIASLLAR